MIIDIILSIIILAVVICAVTYIIRAKKRGVKCIGCSQAGCCTGKEKYDSGHSCGCERKE